VLLFKRKKRNRILFEFFDGTRTRKEDPLPLWRALWAHPDFGEDVVQDAAEGEVKAGSLLVQILRDVFGLTPFTGNPDSGLSEIECYDVFESFIVLMDRIKKKRPPLPQRSPHTDSESSGSNNSTTKLESA
jgi:hypothetical protein